MTTADGSRPTAALSVRTSSTRAGSRFQLSAEQSTNTGRRAQVGDGGGAGDEGEGWNQHLVAALDAGQQQSEVQRRRSAREGHRVRRAGPLGHLALEGVDVRPGRRDPVGIERLEKHPPLLGSHIRRGEEDAAHALRPSGIAQAADKGGATENGRRRPPGRCRGPRARRRSPTPTTMLTTTTIMTSTAM